MKAGMLEKKLELPAETAVLIREKVASANMSLFCMDANRWWAINKAGVDVAKLDALADYHTSPLFSDAERAALAFATELTEDRHVSPDTFAELARHYSEREICDVVFLVASEAPQQHQQPRAEHRIRRDGARPARPSETRRGPRYEQ